MSVVLPCLSLGFVTAVSAQQTLGSINGAITDSSGAAVNGARVDVTGDGNGVKLSTNSKTNGTYQFQNLPVGVYTVRVELQGFDAVRVPAIQVQEGRTATIPVVLKVGNVSTSIDVNLTPLLNQTDGVNGYVLESQTVQEIPLATGSFTQLAILAPGVSAELLSGIGTNNGLGNQPIWANGQRDTSNGFQVNGVDVTNLFNGKSSSASESGRLAFNIGQGGATAGQQQTNTSVYGSNGNGLASPSPEFIQEVTVNTSQYNADQGNHSGAQISVTTATGANRFHGQLYGHRATNFLNADPYFNKQAVLTLGTSGVSILPQLHRYTAGGTASGPIFRDKLFFFAGGEYGRVTDETKNLSQIQVPNGLTDDRSQAGILAAINSYNATSVAVTPGSATPHNGVFDPVAVALLQAKFPNGQYLIPSAQQSTLTTSNVTLSAQSLFKAYKGSLGLDYNVNQRDRLAAKYYYQSSPTIAPFTYANTGGFPAFQDNGAQVGALTNTITFGPRINWEQRFGFSRSKVNSTFKPLLTNNTFGIGFPGGNGLPALSLGAFAYSKGGSVTVGPQGSFPNTGYFQNRWNPESNIILSLGKHNISAGSNFSYTQLNIRNRRAGQGTLSTSNFVTFVEGIVSSSSELIGNSNRYYRANDAGAFVQDQWRILPNLTLTGGVRYDYNGGFTEKYGNMFNFDPSRYNVTFSAVNDAGFIVAGNNHFSPTPGVSNSTLTGRQWGISPRLAFAYTPRQNNGKVVFNGSFGTFYDRGEYFSYLSQPAGGGFSGPFGVTNAPPLVNQVNGAGTRTLSNPLGSAVIPVSSSDPAQFNKLLVTQQQLETGCEGHAVEVSGSSCAVSPANFGAYARDNKLPYTINFSTNVQVQLTNSISFQLGYTGNRGRHLVVPTPFNEPQIATPGNPLHGDQTGSYGYEVLNANSPYTSGGKTYYNPIANEPFNTASGGNVDLRVPYIGYSPNATLYKAAGVSAYDALQTHLEKRMGHGMQLGASYTWSHTHDEQSAVGLFFVGNNPNNLRDSYATSDFDRTHILNLLYKFELPKFVPTRTLAGKFIDGWIMVGTATLQSGQAFSLYDFSGAVGSLYFGTAPNVADPVIAVKNPKNTNSVRTGAPGTQVVRSGGVNTYFPTIDSSQLKLNNLAPGQKGVPLSVGNEPQDIFENDFTPGQRNLFRQSPQRAANVSFQKSTDFTDRINLRYTLDVFNITNTPSFDIPTNSSSVGAGRLGLGTTSVAGGQIISSPNTSSTDYSNFYKFPTTNSTYGAVRNVIGQARQIEMSLKLQF